MARNQHLDIDFVFQELSEMMVVRGDLALGGQAIGTGHEKHVRFLQSKVAARVPACGTRSYHSSWLGWSLAWVLVNKGFGVALWLVLTRWEVCGVTAMSSTHPAKEATSESPSRGQPARTGRLGPQ